MAVAVEVFYLIIAAECERRDVFLVILKSQMYHGNKNSLVRKLNSGFLKQCDYQKMLYFCVLSSFSTLKPNQ